jgi:arylsulfatase A-like enzyme
MKKQVTRRDFLKLAGMLPLSVVAPRVITSLQSVQEFGKSQNVLIIVFDAFSAYNISLYGYQRETTPNFARLAERAVVYHNHYAGGNFTPTGTASLLTGTLPWTHRAFGLGKNLVKNTYVERNIFAAFRNYHRFAYTHNQIANGLIDQFGKYLEEHIPLGKLFLTNDNFIEALFNEDEDIATVSWVRAMKNREEGFAYSLFTSHLYERIRERKVEALKPQFPLGLPYIAGDNYFLLEDAIEWLRENLGSLPQPFMGYFHFMPPHRPYHTHKDFYRYFGQDGFSPPQKSISVFADKNENYYNFLQKRRREYDEFILYVDREFGRLFDHLDRSGLLENTWLVLTSDHGEMFERGILGHITPVLYQPVVRIPLMIFEPGRKARADIHVPTSAIDILPTLLYVTGQLPSDWTEGTVMPPFSNAALTESRDIYIVEAKKNDSNAPLTIATTALIKDGYKLKYFKGYEEFSAGDWIELYDLENDPEEMNNLSTSKRETAMELLDEIRTKLAEVNRPYL